MRHGRFISTKARAAWALALTLTFAAFAFASPATAAPPWDGTSFSPWLGTPGTTWCAGPAPGTNIANKQGPPLALIPQEAFGCLLEQFRAEATTAGISPQRLNYNLLPRQSAGGRNHYVAVVNALETPGQVLRYQRYQQLRALETEDPVAAQALLTTWAGEVKMPVFIEANIHGDEEEGADAMMQAIRDLATLPRGTDPLLDKILDYSVLIVIPNMNPDGRFSGLNGVRQNANNFDMNRDFLVQSQPEVKNNIEVQQQWLATNGLALHGYYSPTLNDGLTKPHNPGMEYDIFLGWNQRRLDDNEARVHALPGLPGSERPGVHDGYGMQRPVNDWCVEADHPVWFTNDQSWWTTGVDPACPGGTPAGPENAEGWDDWGPFYTQTYISLIGIDGSTVEMCSSTQLQPRWDLETGTPNPDLDDAAQCGGEGRLGSKKVQYVIFYSSMDYWLDNRAQMMMDQVEIYRRGVTDANRVNCCNDPAIQARGFTDAEHNWMVPYPKAYIIPRDGSQRSNAEANRLVRWLLDNGIKVTTANSQFSYSGEVYPAGSYIVWMNQALRGLALTALTAGQDISPRISELYAPPGAWSHGWLWGADSVEIPRGATFAPATTPITTPTPLTGGVRGGTSAPADWYSVTLRGPSEVRTILGLLRNGVVGEMAEAPFTSTTGGSMPAGTLIFPNDSATVAAIHAAGQSGGIWFERNVGVTKPATSQVEKAPKVAILVNSAAPAISDQSEALEQIFGPDATFLSLLTGTGSVQNAPTDPLLGYDVIYNTGQNYPAAANATARTRLQAFFARGGGYIGTGGGSAANQNNFSFLTGASLVDAFVQSTDTADGGIALWRNSAGSASPITGGYPVIDSLFLPQNVSWFSSIPTGAVVDGRYLNNTGSMFLAGLWLDRNAAAGNAPVIVHGTTTAGSRYMGLATNWFSRQDAEREWTLIGQAALWSALTDEADSTISFPANNALYGDASWDGGCSAGVCGTADGSPGPAISKVQVAVQQVSTGQWWNGTAFASATPVYADAAGTSNWTYAFPSSRLADGAYIVRSKAIAAGVNEELTPDSNRFTFDGTNPAVVIRSPGTTTYTQGQNVSADYECTDAGSGVASCSGTVADGAPIDTSSAGTHTFTVQSTDAAGNQTTETVTYQVALLNCSLSARGRLVATRRGTINARVTPSGESARPIRINVRGAGVNRTVTLAGASNTAAIRVKPTRAGTIWLTASSANMAPCRASVAVKRAPKARTGTAGTGSGGGAGPGLTGRPR